MKKILYIILWNLFVLSVKANSLKDAMLPNNNTIWVTWEWLSPLTQVIIYIKDFMFYILWIIAVWVFLYFGFKLTIARWDEEEFKKTLLWFVYAIVWLAIIPLAWWAVKIVTTLKF